MEAQLYEVEMGVKGAYRITRRVFETETEAVARAERWARSNSTGDYWAEVVHPVTGPVARFNLPDPGRRVSRLTLPAIASFVRDGYDLELLLRKYGYIS